MKILYGVQATGNGHITRARALAKHLQKANITVDYLFSGRAKSDFFDMQTFGNWTCKRGLSFNTQQGRLQLWPTIKNARIRQLIHDIKQLDLEAYDAVITDFEPITAWAAKRAKKLCIGIGHQYAFHHDVPAIGKYSIPYQIMRYFAPCDIGLGLHWHHFGQPILPPIACTHDAIAPVEDNKILVYFGFEQPTDVIPLLQTFPDYRFVYYGEFERPSEEKNVSLRPLSRQGFLEDMSTAAGVMTNAGFELASEAIHSGKKLLVKPLAGQVEQLSNAVALEKLQLGQTMQSFDLKIVEQWLHSPKPKMVRYPNVAQAIVSWLEQGDLTEKSVSKLISDLWGQTRFSG